MPRSVSIPVIAAALAALACGGAVAADQSAAAAASSSLAGKSAPLPGVTVTARRELERQVATFVYHIAARQNEAGGDGRGESLPRWQVPVCPMVQGLSRDEGEFVLWRISDVARTAGVPLAGEHCRPNLVVAMTVDPAKLLRQLPAHDLRLMFGDSGPGVIGEFISEPRAVRVWYSADMETSFGQPPQTMRPEPYQHPDLAHPTIYEATHSRLQSNVVWTLSRVFVIVDQTRLRGVSRGQFADYVAMVGLADIQPGAQLGDAQTILKLFDGAPEAAPPAMSAWDQAFLKSLYATESRMLAQRKAIVRAMVDQIAAH